MIGVLMLWVAFAQEELPAVEPESASEEGKAQARTLFENATVLYEEGDYEASLLALEKAYGLFPTPALKFNMANCLERMGRYDEAIAAMNQYRAVAPAEERVTLERRIRAMDLRAAESKQPAPEPVAPAEPAAVQTRTVKHPTWPLFGVGVGLVVVSGAGVGVSKGMASSAFKKLDRGAYGTARALNITSFVAVGAGVGTAVLGLVLPQKKTVTVAVLPTPAGAAVAFGGSL